MSGKEQTARYDTSNDSHNRSHRQWNVTRS